MAYATLYQDPADPGVYHVGTCEGYKLQAHWTFESITDNETADSAGGDDNGTLVNGPTLTTGIIGDALSFDGVDDYVDIGEQDFGIDDTNEFTVALWVNIYDNTIGYHPIISRGPYTYPFNVKMENSRVRPSFRTIDNSYYSIYSTTDLMIGEWYHIAFSYNDGTGRVYVNGNEEDSQTVTGSDELWLTNGTKYTSIGKVLEYYFEGTVDDIRIYNRALSAAEIAALYNVGQ